MNTRILDQVDRLARESRAAKCACGKRATQGELCTRCDWDKFEASNRALPPDQQVD